LNLENYGWSSHFARAFAARAGAGERPGRIVSVHGAECTVWAEDGVISAMLAGSLREGGGPVTGDWVVLRTGADVVEAILPRRTLLARARPGGEGGPQALAANIDVLLIVMGLDGDYNPRRLERYLVLAADAGADPVVILSKSDLRTAAGVEEALAEVRATVPGVPVLPWSAVTDETTEVIGGCVAPGQTAAVAGSSGAGKSTLINRLLGREALATAPVRVSDSRGRHTTTRRELIPLPQGWIVADLPGLREVGLWADPGAVAHVFRDLAEAARRCRFRDCTHTNEPGCAVLEAAASGTVESGRLAGFRKLSREAGSAREAKLRWEKEIARAVRQYKRLWDKRQ
jgi:ribosome biogenesis GTPase